MSVMKYINEAADVNSVHVFPADRWLWRDTTLQNTPYASVSVKTKMKYVHMIFWLSKYRHSWHQAPNQTTTLGVNPEITPSLQWYCTVLVQNVS